MVTFNKSYYKIKLLRRHIIQKAEALTIPITLIESVFFEAFEGPNRIILIFFEVTIKISISGLAMFFKILCLLGLVSTEVFFKR